MTEESSETSSIKSHMSKKNEDRQDLRRLPWKIYVSRALSAWGDRLWSFGAGIFMVELAPDNLRLVSIYGLVLSISVILFGAPIGNWIDKSQRLKAARIFLATQNLVTALSCVILGLYFGQVGIEYWPSWIPDAVPIVTIILAAISQLASVGSKIVVEKDWIVVIADSNDDRLAQINAVFRTIDLTALTLSPLSAGLVFDLSATTLQPTLLLPGTLSVSSLNTSCFNSFTKNFLSLVIKRFSRSKKSRTMTLKGQRRQNVTHFPNSLKLSNPGSYT